MEGVSAGGGRFCWMCCFVESICVSGLQGDTTVCEGGMIVVNATHLCSKCYVYTASQGFDLQRVCSQIFLFVYSHTSLRRLLRARCLRASTVSIIIGVWMQIFTGRVDTFVRISIIVGHVLFNGATVSANGLHNHHEGDRHVILR